MDPSTSLIAQGGVVGLFLAAAYLITSLFREKNRDVTSLKADVRALKAENLVCNWRVNALMTICRAGGLNVPDNLFRGDVPDE